MKKCFKSKIIGSVVFLLIGIFSTTIFAQRVQVLHQASASNSRTGLHSVVCNVDGVNYLGPLLAQRETANFFIPQGNNYNCIATFHGTSSSTSCRINILTLPDRTRFTGRDFGLNELIITTSNITYPSCTIRVAS